MTRIFVWVFCRAAKYGGPTAETNRDMRAFECLTEVECVLFPEITRSINSHCSAFSCGLEGPGVTGWTNGLFEYMLPPNTKRTELALAFNIVSNQII